MHSLRHGLEEEDDKETGESLNCEIQHGGKP